MPSVPVQDVKLVRRTIACLLTEYAIKLALAQQHQRPTRPQPNVLVRLFNNSVSHFFKACPLNCLECNSSGCQTCEANYLVFVEDGECYPTGSCPTDPATYETATNCVGEIYLIILFLTIYKACTSNCAQCTSAGCQTCQTSHRLFAGDGLCYPTGSCPTAPATYETSDSCIDCPLNCAQCTSSGCQVCQPNYRLFAGDGVCYQSGFCPTNPATYETDTHCVGEILLMFVFLKLILETISTAEQKTDSFSLSSMKISYSSAYLTFVSCFYCVDILWFS